jgi:hypothetical protein
MLESLIQSDSKAKHTGSHVSMSNWIAAQLSGIRWGYKTGLRLFLPPSDSMLDPVPTHLRSKLLPAL